MADWEGYHLIARRPLALFERLLDRFCGNAHISFEGDLSKCDLRRIQVVSREPLGVLRSNTLYPKLDFVILPLEAETIEILKRQVLPRIGIRKRVIHTLIEKGGKLVFAAYNNMDPGCIWICNDVSEEFLQDLVESGSIKKYSPVHSLDKEEPS